MSGAITQIRTVLVPVSDQEAALAFYRDTLGFALVVDAPFGQGQRWVEVAPPGAATSIALAPTTSSTPLGADTGIRFSTDDADGMHATLLERGADVDSEILRWPGVPAMFTLRDPDGNVLYVVESM